MNEASLEPCLCAECPGCGCDCGCEPVVEATTCICGPGCTCADCPTGMGRL